MAVITKVQTYLLGNERFSEAVFDAANEFSVPIGVFNDFQFILDGTFVATVTLQKSLDYFKYLNDGGDGTSDVAGAKGLAAAAASATWIDVTNYTTGQNLALHENNQYVYYRFGVKTSNYTSGNPHAKLIANTY